MSYDKDEIERQRRRDMRTPRPSAWLWAGLLAVLAVLAVLFMPRIERNTAETDRSPATQQTLNPSATRGETTGAGGNTPTTPPATNR